MPTLPKGALELLIALQTPSPKGHRGIPVLVWGAPGVGKSSFIESLARPDYPVITLIASLHDPTDFNGLPTLHDGRVRFTPPEWVFLFEEAGKGILFLDELTTAPPTVQAALLRLVLERKVGLHSLPKEVSIAAAANPPDLAASGWELSPPLANRFVHLNWELPSETFQDALESGGFPQAPTLTIDPARHAERLPYWRAIVINFLKRSSGMLHSTPAEGEFAFASPRTWDYAIALMASCDLLGYAPRPSDPSRETTPFIHLVYGCLGSGVAAAFLQHLRQLRIPDPEEVLHGRAALDPKLREDELMTLFSAMAGILQRYEKQRRPETLACAQRFLQGALQVAQANKADAIYTTLRSMVQQGRLQNWAQQSENVLYLLNSLDPYYEHISDLLEEMRYKVQPGGN
jgi:hypothetical protein